MTGPEDNKALPKNVDEVDCDNFNNSFEKLRGHAFFLAEPVIKLLTTAIRAARVSPKYCSYELPK